MSTLEEAGLELRQLSIPPYDNNCYILVCRETGESVVIDPSNEAERILEATAGTRPRYILLTHGDFDHIGALTKVRSVLRVPVGIHPDDEWRLPNRPDFHLHDGDVLEVGRLKIHVLHTPGHTAGGVCFLIGKTLISGDTLFPGGPGKTDRDGGNFPQIIEAIETRLFTLPDDTAVYPGHGKPTTIGTERPHLQEWIARGW